MEAVLEALVLMILALLGWALPRILRCRNEQEKDNEGKGKAKGLKGLKKRLSRPTGVDVRRFLLSLLITLLILAILYYFTLPAMNPKSAGFWVFLFGAVLLLDLSYRGLCAILVYRHAKGGDHAFSRARFGASGAILFILRAALLALIALPLLIALFGSAPFFHARAYSRILTVTDGDVTDIPSVEGTSSIALMDTQSAAKLGSREMGSLSSVISQYEVSAYTQINYHDAPVKTSPLRYAGFFKWIGNHKNGVPGYVLVDPVRMEADYNALPQGMIYVPSAYLSEDLSRRIRFRYPTKMFTNVHFEIDEDGNPWYVASVCDHTIGLFGGTQVVGAILVNPVTGDMEYCDVSEVPQWVDCVFPGELICEQYNNYAQLSGGFWNSIIGQVGCRRVTEAAGTSEQDAASDYGYIAKNGDVWVYTGVTSVNTDSSNIGFILSNQRTEETLFVSCAGADEFSGMAAAEGEVQEKGYQASFPSLILVDGNPTYIMVLKDDNGLVKMYAAVNVEQYNMVATAATQADCIGKYRALVGGEISQEEAIGEETPETETDTSGYETKTVTIQKLQTIDRDGNTWLYLVDTDDNIYCAKYEDVIGMLLYEEGDRITILTDGTNFALPDTAD